MSIYSTNRLSFAGAEPEFDLRPGSRFSGLRGLIEYCDILCEGALLDDEISTILEAEGDETEEKTTSTTSTEEENKDNKNSLKINVSDLIEKIRGLIEKIVSAIKDAFTNAKVKLIELTNMDETFVNKYKEVLLNGNKLEGFNGVSNVGDLSVALEDEKNFLDIGDEKVKNITDIYTSAIEELEKVTSQEAAISIRDKFNEDLKALVEEKKDNNDEKKDEKVDNSKYGTMNDEGFIPSRDTLTKIEKILIKSKEIHTGVVKAIDESNKRFKDIENKCKRLMKEGSDIEKFKARIAYGMTITTCNRVSTTMSKALSDTLKGYAAIRKVWLVSGKYASAKNSNK